MNHLIDQILSRHPGQELLIHYDGIPADKNPGNPWLVEIGDNLLAGDGTTRSSGKTLDEALQKLLTSLET